MVVIVQLKLVWMVDLNPVSLDRSELRFSTAAALARDCKISSISRKVIRQEIALGCSDSFGTKSSVA
jgi:hypothetical protein